MRYAIEEESDDDQCDQGNAQQHRDTQVVKRLLDEGGWPEDRSVDRDSRQSGCISRIASSTPRVTSTVFARGTLHYE